MGKEIASTYATIGIKDDAFKKGLTNAKGLLTKLNDSKLGQITQQLTGFSLSSIGAAGGVAMVVKEIGKMVSGASTYISSIQDMSRVLGISAEDTSRLVQASDDLFISQEQLNTALLAASRQGIDVSIKGLKILAEKYYGLNPGTERAQFLMKTFGRSGADMGKLMEQGALGIDAATKAISGGLIVTDKAIEQNIQYKQVLDDINDTMEGIKTQVGTGLMLPVILIFRPEKGMEYAIAEQKELDKTGQKVKYDMYGLNQAFAEYSDTLVDTTQQMQRNDVAQRIFKEDARRSYDLLSNGLNPALDSAAEKYGSLAMQEADAALNAGDAVEAIAKVKDELVKFTDIDIDFGDKILSQLDKLAFEMAGGTSLQAIKQAIDDAITDHRITPNQAQSMYQELYLQSAALKVDMGKNVDEVAADVATALGITIAEAKKGIDEYRNYVQTNPITQKVILDYLGGDPYAYVPSTPGGAGQGGQNSGGHGEAVPGTGGIDYGAPSTPHASGGSWMIPMQYGYEGYRMPGGQTASGGEEVTITPRGQSQSSGVTMTQLLSAMAQNNVAIISEISKRFA